MATSFPTSLDTLTNPTSSDSLSSPSHSSQHANVNDAVEALQAKVGVDSSAVTSSLDYKVAQLEAISHGKILQVVSTLKTDTYTTTSSTFTTVTGLTATITPSSTSSKILIMAQVNMSLTTYSVYARLSGGNTSTYLGDAASNRVQSVVSMEADNDNPFWRTQFSMPLMYLDSPATTSSVTYGVDVRIGTGAVYVNRSQDDSDTVNYGRTASTITVMEVSA